MSGKAKVGYGISFFGVLRIITRNSYLLSMVWVVFLPEVETYTLYQIKVNDCYVNIEIVLINLKEDSNFHFSVFAILVYIALKSPDEGSILYGTLLPLGETNAFIICSTHECHPFPMEGWFLLQQR